MKNYRQIGLKLFLFIPFLLWHFNSFGQITITGKVTDDTGSPLPGANVVVKGTTNGTSTNGKGLYKLDVSTSADTLVFSFIGFKTQTVPIKGRTEINVTLRTEVQQGQEMVVVGYGVQTKESVIGAISSVSGSDLETAQSTGDLTTSLQGSAPGLTVFTQGEAPGETQTQIQIRAATSMTNNNPLFIVDGTEVQSISDIDPIEIESISVLKGASATAVYGVKAANGVIIVKTKRGHEGNLQLNFSSETTVKQPTRLPHFMNAYQTLKLRNEAYKNDGQWDKLVSQDALDHYRKQDSPYLYPSFNWSNYLWKPAVDQKYNLNASGGNEFVQYFASVSYLRENDILNSGDLAKVFPYQLDNGYWSNRYNFRNNLDFKLSSTTHFSAQLSGNIQDWNRPIDYYTQELMFEPVTSRPYYPAEALQQFPDNRIPYNQTGVRPFNDPTQGVIRLLWIGGEGVSQQKSNDFNANLILKQDLDFITKGLELTGRYSYQSFQHYGANDWLPNFYGYHLNPSDSTWTRYTNTGDEDLNTPQPKINIVPTKSLWDANRSQYYRLQTNYKRTFAGSHNVSVTGVFSRRQARGIADFPHYEEDWTARGTYNYQNKYFFESSIAYTGSEKFAPGYRFGTFPSFGVGWMPSNEQFFKDAVPWFNHLKVKYTWGRIGSDAGIPRWLYQSSYQPNSDNVTFGNPTQGYPVIAEGAVPVPDATWETATKQNLGIEMGFLDSQVTLDVDLYTERRSNILQTRNSVPTWMGVTSGVYANIGETKAHGIEMKLGLNKTFDSGFNVNFKGNVSAYETRVVNWDEPDTVPFNLRAEGKPVDLARRMNYYTPTMGVQVGGYYQNFDQLFIWPLASGPSPIVGDQTFMDYNGDGTVDGQDAVVAAHPFTPTMNWNANLGFRYKNWSLNVVFYGISQVNYPLRQGGMFFLYPFSQNKNEALSSHANHWTPSNRDAEFPAVHSFAQDQYNYRISSFSIVNGQYIRLKRAVLGYTLRSKGLTNMGVDQIQLTLTGTNLWTWTRLPFGGDPEGANYGQDFGAYPISQRFSLRAQIKF